MCQNQKCVQIKSVSKSKVCQNNDMSKKINMCRVKTVPKANISKHQKCVKIKSVSKSKVCQNQKCVKIKCESK